MNLWFFLSPPIFFFSLKTCHIAAWLKHGFTKKIIYYFFGYTYIYILKKNEFSFQELRICLPSPPSATHLLNVPHFYF